MRRDGNRSGINTVAKNLVQFENVLASWLGRKNPFAHLDKKRLRKFLMSFFMQILTATQFGAESQIYLDKYIYKFIYYTYVQM